MDITNMVYYDKSSKTMLRWKISESTKIRKDMQAGRICSTSGYGRITWRGSTEYIHNVVWKLFHGNVPENHVVDHIDLDKSNNSIDNLRVCTIAENNRNTAIKSTNKTGVKGLFWDKYNNCWRGTVTINGKVHYKRSKDFHVLEAWIAEMRESLHGEFCNHGAVPD